MPQRSSLFLLTVAALLGAAATRAAEPGWVSLFNGKDLTGWETCLGPPAGERQPIGLNKDPKKVFQIVTADGEPAIRISGEGLGGLATLEEFGNYLLELEFKWGEKRFPPRAEAPRDSGLLYHGVNGYNPGTGWLESVEFGILEGGETGDFWSVPGKEGVRVMVDLEGEDIPKGLRRYPDQPIKYRPGGKKYRGVTSGILNGDDNEKPRGQWNKLELICVGQTGIHVVNGTVNLVLTNIRRKVDGKEQPLTRGRIQLQSEGAEVFYRRLRLRPIKEIPERYRQALKEPPPNTLTADEKAKGWKLLFDGKTTAGWRGYRQKEAPKGWEVKDGALVRTGKAGDLITTGTFDDFELLIDFKIGYGGNSGIFFRFNEEGKVPYETGPEFEIRDNAFWTDDPYRTGANYAMHVARQDAAHPVGYWNRARIVAHKNRVEHWLNGQKVVEYELLSPDWEKRLRASKYYKNSPNYGRLRKGHIGLQDHGDLVWYRNIKLRPLRDRTR